MTFPAYTVIPVSGASVQLGASTPTPVQPDDQRWCTQADAQLILNLFLSLGVSDAKLVDASATPVNGVLFTGVSANSPARPWYLVSSAVTGPVGPALWIQLGPNNINGGGRGNPGSWTGVLTGNPRYVPEPLPPVLIPAPVIDSSGDPGAFGTAQGVPAVVFTQADRDAINNINRLMKGVAGYYKLV